MSTVNGQRSTVNGSAPHVDVAIVGSGFAGLGMGYRLLQEGIEDFVILERGEDVGGTWWWNTYPGCQCDIPSHLYSFSFAPNPEWSRTYPLQREIQTYLHDCAEKFGLMPYIQFGREVAAGEVGRGERALGARDERAARSPHASWSAGRAASASRGCPTSRGGTRSRALRSTRRSGTTR